MCVWCVYVGVCVFVCVWVCDDLPLSGCDSECVAGRSVDLVFGYVLMQWCWGVFQEFVLESLVRAGVLECVYGCVVTLGFCPNIRALCSHLCDLVVLAHWEHTWTRPLDMYGVYQTLGFDSGPQVPAISPQSSPVQTTPAPMSRCPSN